MEPRAVFAHNLRMERERKRWTQEFLAHTAGLHPTEVSRLERAARDPRLTTIAQLAHALDVHSSTLLTGVDATMRSRPPAVVTRLADRADAAVSPPGTRSCG
jgi:transcriptional regulator with XRE-family HTH domain